MREQRSWSAASIRGAASALALALTAIVGAAPASANVGYALDSTPSKSLGEYIPHGIAVDQATQKIYVAIVSREFTNKVPGEVDRFESNLTSAGVFTGSGETYYAGVAVNPVTGGFYADQARIVAPFGEFGTSKMDVFSSAGTPGSPFTLSETGAVPQIAVDSSGDVYYPNATGHSVQVFNSSGTLQETITCSGCTGGSFGKPVSVALNSEDDLYVVDLAPDRVVKLTSSGGPYAFASVLQSGRGAAAVGVDPSGDDVFVGDLPGGSNYHIVAYSSSGTQFDDFGAGLFVTPNPAFGALAAGQIAADETTHKVYVTDANKFYVFARGTINPPTTTIKAATAVGQLTATLNATVNANGHAVLECEFEYTDHADFLVNGFTNADTSACPKNPDGSSSTALEDKISTLTPGTLYHYRVTATSNAGTTSSSATTFETLPSVAPTVTMEPALGVTETAATLSAKVNPHGGSVSACHFDYGTSASYGTSVSCASLPGSVTTDVAESKGISGLLAGTTYHYRLVVSSNAGTTNGSDVAFTTSSPPVSQPPIVVPPVEEPPVTVTPKPPARPLHCKKGFRKKKVRGKLRCVRRKHARKRVRRS